MSDISNKEHWAYKFYNEEGNILRMIDKNLCMYCVKIELGKKGNIYILQKEKKTVTEIQIEKEEKPVKLKIPRTDTNVPIPPKGYIFAGYEDYKRKFTFTSNIHIINPDINNIQFYIFNRQIDDFKDLEIIDAIVDNQNVPVKYFDIIEEHIKTLQSIDKIIDYLKYVKKEINEKNNVSFKEEIIKNNVSFKEEIIFNLEQYKQQIDNKIKDSVLGLEEQILRYKKIESVIKENYPHLSKYFDVDIDLVISEEEKEIIKTRNNLQEKLDKLKANHSEFITS